MEKASLEMLLRAQYGVRSSYNVNPGASSVGTSIVRIAPINPKRVGLLIVNTGTVNIYIGPNKDVSSTKGIWLPAGGSAFSISWEIDMELVSSGFYAKGAAAGGTVYVLETVLQDVAT